MVSGVPSLGRRRKREEQDGFPMARQIETGAGWASPGETRNDRQDEECGGHGNRGCADAFLASSIDEFAGTYDREEGFAETRHADQAHKRELDASLNPALDAA